MKIIFHTPDEKNKRSPFDSSISKVVKNESIKIACPYIGLDYFQNTIITLCKDWKLLTDINELFSSCCNKKAIIKLMDFIKKNCINIRHLTGLHSKVIISSSSAFFGSANLTVKGITERREYKNLKNK